ncbi:MAG: ABC transporter permease [Alphaproteobacteria bacterium]|jgi:putative spermidine/putrescine transport system permease protein|nr:ABC transporter permease [Alphaproteobacteria bacterium]
MAEQDTMAGPGRPAFDRGALKANLRRADRRRKFRAYGLIAPLFLFLLAFFLIPIGSVLYFSISNPEVVTMLPRVNQALRDWDGREIPREATFAALAEDLKRGYANQTLPKVSLRLNYEVSGFRSLLMRTGRKAKRMEAPYKEAIIARDKRWAELVYWRTLKGNQSRFTLHYLLQALDLDLQWDGGVQRAPPEQQIYLSNLRRTLWIALVVTLACIVLGYPVAYLIATAPPRLAKILILLVLLPFWTSLLVRTAAWVIVLQKAGIVNDALMGLGLVDEPLALIFNRTGVYISMVHILLPFMILPLYGVMKGIPGDHVRAATSLGATPRAAFLEVYFPQTLPGLAAGCLLVFVVALGFYITPMLIGGGSDQMLAYLIAQYATKTANWGLAGALAVVLLVCIAVLYPIYQRFAGAGGMKLG